MQDMRIGFEYATRKVMKNNCNYMDSFSIKLARNAREGCQLVINNTSKSKMSIKINFDKSQIDNIGLSCTPYHVRYIMAGAILNRKNYPDALMPYEDEIITIKKNGIACIFLDFSSSINSLAESFAMPITVTNVDNGMTENVRVDGSIWDFSLPETPSCRTAVGMQTDSTFTRNGIVRGTSEGQELYENYYEYMLQHKLSLYELPMHPLDSRADKYLDDKRVTSYVIPYSTTPDMSEFEGKICYTNEQLVQIKDKLNSNKRWHKQHLFYPVDEPRTKKHITAYKVATKTLRENFGDYNMITPFNSDKIRINGKASRMIDMQTGGSNQLCPVSYVLNKSEARSEMKDRQEKGDILWWYVCCGPKGKFCNLFINQDGIRHRMLLWQQKQYNIEGLLYYCCTYWERVDPWKNSKTFTNNDLINYGYGDGSLLYPSKKLGFDEPIPSLRLKLLSIGIDDFEYLCMAEKLFGKTYVDELISTVSTTLEKYTHDDSKLYDVKNSLGEKIEQFYKTN